MQLVTDQLANEKENVSPYLTRPLRTIDQVWKARMERNGMEAQTLVNCRALKERENLMAIHYLATGEQIGY